MLDFMCKYQQKPKKGLLKLRKKEKLSSLWFRQSLEGHNILPGNPDQLEENHTSNFKIKEKEIK